MAKKKIKKLLKGLGVGAALLGAGKALMNRNARASTTADAIKAMTSDAAYGKSPYTDAIMRKQSLGARMMTPQDMANDQMFQNVEMMKKGGRVGCGKAKRGFGRAMKGKK